MGTYYIRFYNYGYNISYGQYYPVLNQMRYIFAIGLAIIVVVFSKHYSRLIDGIHLAS